MGDRFLIRLDKKRRERWEAAAKALFLPLTTFIKAATDEKAEKVLNKTDLDVTSRNETNQDE